MRKSFLGKLAVWLLALGIIVCPIQVQADIIWEPEDSFYKDHAEECEYLKRSYIVDGPGGEVKVYKSPKHARVVKTLKNGTEFASLYTYIADDGIEWGLYEEYDTGVTGWVPKAYLNVVYDYISFEEEFGDQILDESGQLDKKYLDSGIYIWNCPGSEVGEYLALQEYGMEDTPQYEKIFIDEEGRKWGYMGYYIGYRTFWVCLDAADADLETLYPDGKPERGKNTENLNPADEITPTEVEEIVPDTSGQERVMAIATVLVAAVVLVTGGLLISMKRTGEKK